MSLQAQGGAIGDLLSNSSMQSVAPVVSGPGVVTGAVQVKAAVQREWLVMVFINGVNDLGILGYANKSINDMEQVGSSDKMAVLVEYGVMGIADPATRTIEFPKGAKTLYITKDADTSKITSPAIYTSNDVDMGSADNLVRFAKRGIRRYPARKVALIVWNHGGGLQGISFDDLSSNHMEVDKLGQALSQIKTALGHNVDLFATDACLMQMGEVAYELKNSADVIVGSEEVVPDNSYPYDTILGQLAVNTQMGAEELGTVMVDAYKMYYASYATEAGLPGRGDDITLSALRTSALPGFLGKINAWANAVMSDPQALKVATSQAAVDGAYFFEMEESKDLYTYISSVNAKLGITSPAAKNAGTALQSYIDNNLMIRSAVLPAVVKAHGLSIYIPALRYSSGNYEKLAWAADSMWPGYLRTMLEARPK
jgi:hypothetical protein